jgi:hypothetical protein
MANLERLSFQNEPQRGLKGNGFSKDTGAGGWIAVPWDQLHRCALLMLLHAHTMRAPIHHYLLSTALRW